MCCGASRAVGLRPQAAITLGEDNGAAPRYLKVMDGNLIPNVSTGAQLYMTGSGIEQALEEGKLDDVSRPARTNRRKVTKFRVHVNGKEPRDFTAHSTARQYSVRNGGRIEVIQEEPSDG